MPKASFQDTGPRRDNTPAETKPAAVGVWDQSAFTRFMATRDPVQEKKDQKRLRDVFAAAQSTIAKEAFAWAEQNGVKFFIDRSLKNAGAYYTMGTGVVGVGEQGMQSATTAIPLLVHEIRHGWQDKQGMIPTVARSFAEYYTQIALIEADASAWQRAAGREEWSLQGSSPREDRTGGRIFPRAQALMVEFSLWNDYHAAFYGDVASRGMARKLHLHGIDPVDFKTEFRPYAGPDALKVPEIRGISIALDQVVAQLGQGFFRPANDDGANSSYLAQDEAIKHLQQNVLRERLAHRFFGAAAKVPPVVKAVNKALQARAARYRKKHGSDLYI